MRFYLFSLLALLGFSGCSENPATRDEARQSHFSDKDVRAIEEEARIHGELTDEQIEKLVGHYGALDLEGVTELTVPQAEKLCQHKCGLSLGLTTLTDPLAGALSGSQGMFMGLRHLRELSDSQARSLAQYRGMINFGDSSYWFYKVGSYKGAPELKAIHETIRKTGRLTDIEAETLVRLAPLYCLYLSDLVSVTDRQAETLGSYKGFCLILDGLTELTDEQAETFAAFEGELYLKNDALYQKLDDIRSNTD